jgi:hypothetical protein
VVTFNQYIAHRRKTPCPINGNREAFHSYLCTLGRHSYTIDAWDMLWDRFVQWQDSHDEAETLADALR